MIDHVELADSPTGGPLGELAVVEYQPVADPEKRRHRVGREPPLAELRGGEDRIHAILRRGVCAAEEISSASGRPVQILVVHGETVDDRARDRRTPYGGGQVGYR